MHKFESTSQLESIMKRKHFCVESFLKEGEKDPIIETMNQQAQQTKGTAQQKFDYFSNATEFEKQYFQPI